MHLTVAIFVSVCLLALLVGALRLHKAIDRTHERFRRFTGGYREAGRLVASRQRFRERQQRVEKALDTGAVGVQAAHRRLAGLVGSRRDRGAGIYHNLRVFNRGIGRGMSSLFAPTLQKNHAGRAELRPSDSDKGSR